MAELAKFPTIRQEAKHGGLLSEYQLRIMHKQGRLPGFYTGRTFKVNHAQLAERLEEESRAAVKRGGAAE